MNARGAYLSATPSFDALLLSPIVLWNPTDGLSWGVVVVHRAHGFRFVIYTADHAPAHVHVTGAGQAKISLQGLGGEPEIVSSVGIKRSDLRRLLVEAKERRNRFLEEWERIHGQAD